MRLAPATPLLLACLLATPPARAQTVDKVWPGPPSSGEIVGTKPLLRVYVKGTEVHKMKFRIELSRDDFDSVDRTFDQSESPEGWAFLMYGDEWGGIYRVKEPLPGGRWYWRTAAWNGVDWVPGKDEGSFVVDDVPPADVEGIDMRVDRAAGVVHLRWNPVSVDRDGRLETVARYRIYRYEKRSFFFSIRAFEVGTTESTTFDDTDPAALRTPLLFYKVVAEDAAGNEEGRRY